MAVGLSQHAKALRNMRIKIAIYKGDEDSKYKVDIITNDRYLLTTGGFLDKKDIINFIRLALEYAQTYLDFLERASSVDSEMYNLEELRKHLELALAHTLAYETAKD